MIMPQVPPLSACLQLILVMAAYYTCNLNKASKTAHMSEPVLTVGSVLPPLSQHREPFNLTLTLIKSQDSIKCI